MWWIRLKAKIGLRFLNDDERTLYAFWITRNVKEPTTETLEAMEESESGMIPMDVLAEIDEECDRQDQEYDHDAWGMM